MFINKVVLAFLTSVGVLLFIVFLGAAPEEAAIASSGPEGAFISNLSMPKITRNESKKPFLDGPWQYTSLLLVYD